MRSATSSVHADANGLRKEPEIYTAQFTALLEKGIDKEEARKIALAKQMARKKKRVDGANEDANKMRQYSRWSEEGKKSWTSGGCERTPTCQAPEHCEQIWT